MLVGGLGTFVDLINEKGGAACTHKVNGKGRKRLSTQRMDVREKSATVKRVSSILGKRV